MGGTGPGRKQGAHARNDRTQCTVGHRRANTHQKLQNMEGRSPKEDRVTGELNLEGEKSAKPRKTALRKYCKNENRNKARFVGRWPRKASAPEPNDAGNTHKFSQLVAARLNRITTALELREDRAEANAKIFLLLCFRPVLPCQVFLSVFCPFFFF